MALPFLLLVLLVGINFGKAFVLKQRALAAARYAAWQNARTAQASSDAVMRSAGYGDDQMTVSAMSAGNIYGGSTTRISNVIGSAVNFLSPQYTSCAQEPRAVYRVSYQWSPLGRIFRDAEMAGEHHVLLADCRYRGGQSLIGKITSGLGALAFKLIFI